MKLRTLVLGLCSASAFAFAAHADFVTVVGWTALSIVAFNVGLMLGLIIRRPVILSPA